jgi:ribosomal protein S18 acetylase RimI-like enzyme
MHGPARLFRRAGLGGGRRPYLPKIDSPSLSGCRSRPAGRRGDQTLLHRRAAVVKVAAPPFNGVRRATLADVAAVARLSVRARCEAQLELPSLQDPAEVTAPELALRLLEDLDDGHSLYVAERDGAIVGFAQLTGLMVGDGGHLVELRGLFVTPEQRRRRFGRLLLRLALRDLHQRPSPPALRAWAASGSSAARFLEAAGGTVVKQRWKVGTGGLAVRGLIFDWSLHPALGLRGHALA